MSEEVEHNHATVREQITKTPAIESNVKTKEKDPKKVAAGKKLAEYNRKAKEALKEKMKREAEQGSRMEKAQENEVIEERETGESADAEQGSRMGGWIPEVSFTTAISLVGIGLTALNMFMSYRKDTKVLSRDKSLSEPPLTEPPPVIERPQQSKIPVPKMGMH